MNRSGPAVVCAAFTLLSFATANELSAADSSVDAIADGKLDLERKYKAANETLRAAFDRRINQLRAAPKLTAQERQDTIATVESEKATYEKLGWIPSSPMMRSDAINYLNSVQKAEVALGALYDRAVDAKTRAKDDDAARALLDEKKLSLAPRVVGIWKMTLDGKPHFSLKLSSDGSNNSGRWTLDNNHLGSHIKDPRAPGGVWIDTATIAANGRELTMRNNVGTRFLGALASEAE